MIKDWGGDPPREFELATDEASDPSHGVPKNWSLSPDSQRAMMAGDEYKQKTGGFKQKIIEAIVSRDVDRLIRLVNVLDIAWMHPKRQETKSQITGQKDDFVKLLDSLDRTNPPYGSTSIYMSGGGASRLHISFQNGEFLVQPTETSIEAFKTKWWLELQ